MPFKIHFLTCFSSDHNQILMANANIDALYAGSLRIKIASVLFKYFTFYKWCVTKVAHCTLVKGPCLKISCDKTDISVPFRLITPCTLRCSFLVKGSFSNIFCDKTDINVPFRLFTTYLEIFYSCQRIMLKDLYLSDSSQHTLRFSILVKGSCSKI